MQEHGITQVSKRLGDFPSNITIYHAKMTIEDDKGRPLNAQNGFFLQDAEILQPTEEILPLQDCGGNLRGIPIGLGIMPHRWLKSDPLPRPTWFTAKDGSLPRSGMHARVKGGQLLLVTGVSLNPDKALQTMVKVEFDYGEGKPNITVVSKDFTPIQSDACANLKMIRTKDGAKTWMSRMARPFAYDDIDSDIYSLRKSLGLLG
jgi:hypothetical protein